MRLPTMKGETPTRTGTMDSSPPSDREKVAEQRTCQVPGCDYILEKSTASAYCWRYRLCPTHLNASEVIVLAERGLAASVAVTVAAACGVVAAIVALVVK